MQYWPAIHKNADLGPPRHSNTYYLVCTELNLQQGEHLVANETNLGVFFDMNAPISIQHRNMHPGVRAGHSL